MKKNNKNIEHIIRNILIALTIISLAITTLNFTYLVYQDRNIEIINNFLITYVNGPVYIIDNILVFIFSIIYIILAIKSKNERILKIFFSLFAIFTTITSLTLIINVIADIFHIFT